MKYRDEAKAKLYGRENAPETPPHLGGHAWTTHVDVGAIRTLKGIFDIETAYDVGCSVGGMVKALRENDIVARGIDGDPAVKPDILWDFTKGVLHHLHPVDLVWCVEFLEHVEERYMPNYMHTLKLGRVICCTYAPPGKIGHHHVNLQTHDYWRGAFAAMGYEFDKKGTNHVRDNSTMKKDFIRDRGMVFVRRS